MLGARADASPAGQHWGAHPPRPQTARTTAARRARGRPGVETNGCKTYTGSFTVDREPAPGATRAALGRAPPTAANGAHHSRTTAPERQRPTNGKRTPTIARTLLTNGCLISVYRISSQCLGVGCLGLHGAAWRSAPPTTHGGAEQSGNSRPKTPTERHPHYGILLLLSLVFFFFCYCVLSRRGVRGAGRASRRPRGATGRPPRRPPRRKRKTPDRMVARQGTAGTTFKGGSGGRQKSDHGDRPHGNERKERGAREEERSDDDGVGVSC